MSVRGIRSRSWWLGFALVGMRNTAEWGEHEGFLLMVVESRPLAGDIYTPHRIGEVAAQDGMPPNLWLCDSRFESELRRICDAWVRFECGARSELGWLIEYAFVERAA